MPKIVFEFNWLCLNTQCSDDYFTLFVLKVLVIFFIEKLARLWIFSTFSFGKLLEKFNLEKPGKWHFWPNHATIKTWKNLEIDEN